MGWPGICATAVFAIRVFSKLLNKNIFECTAYTDPGVQAEDGNVKGYSTLKDTLHEFALRNNIIAYNCLFFSSV